MTPMLDPAYIRELFNYDPETGILSWKKGRRGGISAGASAGYRNGDSIRIQINYHSFPITAIIWVWVNGYWPKGWPEEFVDHIDRNPFNNKLSNLRLATYSQNNMNSSPRWDNTSGVRGVHYRRDMGKFYARIDVNSKVINLGAFETLEEAATARREAELKYFGEFAPKE